MFLRPTINIKRLALLLGRAWTSWLIALPWLLRGGIILLIIMERCWRMRREGVEYYWEDEDFQRCNSRGLNELWKRKILLLSCKMKLFPDPECCAILDIIFSIIIYLLLMSYFIILTLIEIGINIWQVVTLFIYKFIYLISRIKEKLN